MTNIIFELSRQAEEYANSIPAANVEVRIWKNHYNAKFAELIIQECVICAEREWIRDGSDTEHNQAVSKVIESIKQHFGVVDE